MILRGRAWTFGENISTDLIIPGRYAHLRGDLAELAKHTLEDIRPEFASTVRPGDIVVGGRNFGIGSSREHAVLVLKWLGVNAVVATSIARIFFRNCINAGLLAIEMETTGIEDGDELEVDLTAHVLRDRTKSFQRSFSPLPKVMRVILSEGGVVPYIRKYGRFPEEHL
jgi:3-isopropylmalate/(R)-2-methylmalate dehydratase small subunit